MRCKACDRYIEEPILIKDQETGEKHEEWMCHKCNSLSFVPSPTKQNHGEDNKNLLEQLVKDGFIRQEDL